MSRDLRLQWQIFLGVGVFVAIIDAVYWFVSYERAGTTMLALASTLALFTGVWLFLQDRRGGHSAPTDAPGTAPSPDSHADAEPYMPTASWWPLVSGAGVALALNGLIISWPYATPGFVVLAIGVSGFVNDSRRRA